MAVIKLKNLMVWKTKYCLRGSTRERDVNEGISRQRAEIPVFKWGFYCIVCVAVERQVRCGDSHLSCYGQATRFVVLAAR